VPNLRLSPVTSKPASRGRIKTSHSEVSSSYQFFRFEQGLFYLVAAGKARSLPVNCLLD
jgi:hypothetical protein